MTFTGVIGATYQLGPTPIASGGEGEIYNVLGMDSQIAKIYKADALTPKLEEKLTIMIEHPPSEAVMSQVAWPLDMLCDESGQCCGFVMPKLNINAELGEIYKYPAALPISVQQKINIAQNICVVISEVHKAGYVFGDFNPRNIGLDKDTGLVSFLDTDTYHVISPVGGKTYRCTVCAPGYAAPELLAKCSDFIAENPNASKSAYAQTPLPTFTQETDNFALAIHIFKLLMNGYTPFGGIIETSRVSQAAPGVGDAAVRRDSYCFKPGMKPQSVAIPALIAFPKKIKDFFNRAFIEGKNDPSQRPTAEEWHSALTECENTFVTCSKNELHQYYNINSDCPFCAADERFAKAMGGHTASQSKLVQTTYKPSPPINPPATTPPTPISKPVAPLSPVTLGALPSTQKQSPAPTIQVKQSRKFINAPAQNPSSTSTPSSIPKPTQTKSNSTSVQPSKPNTTITKPTIVSISKTLFKAKISKYRTTIATSESTSFAIQPDNSLWAWGNNANGQLGNGKWEDRVYPIKIMEDAASVSAGRVSHVLAVKTDGSLWAWGVNARGQLGDGTGINRSSPVKVLNNVIAVSAGHGHSLAIKNDKSLWAWGFNSHGEIGDGTLIDKKTPIKVMEDVISICAGNWRSMAIKSDGSLWSWGREDFILYKSGGEKSCIQPKKIMDGVAKVSLATLHSMVIKIDGSLWGWGFNRNGELGDGTKINRPSPVKIMDNASDVSTGRHTMALTAVGNLWGWGANDKGQLGFGIGADKLSPQEILRGIAAVSVGEDFTIAIKNDGGLQAWGGNSLGQLGDGTTIERHFPVNVMH